MIWVIYGILHSMFRAAFAETNRVYRVNGWHLTFWHALFGTVILAPFSPFMNWPTNMEFYLAAILIALIFSIGNVMQMTLAGQRRGRLASIYMPLEAMVAMLIWAIVAPGTIAYYTDNLLVAGGVLLGLFVSTVALFRVRANDASLPNFLLVLPVAMTYAISGVVIKLVLNDAEILSTALSFVLINFCVMSAVMGLVLLLKKMATKEMAEVRVLKAGVLTGLFGVLAYFTFVVSLVYVPNPGYTSMFAMLMPVWMFVVHKFIKVDDDAKPLATAGIVAGIVILVTAVYMFG